MQLKNLQVYIYRNGLLVSANRPPLNAPASTPSSGLGLGPFGTSPFGR